MTPWTVRVIVLIVLSIGVSWHAPAAVATVRRMRQSRFSLRDLLVAMTVIAVVLGLAVWAAKK